MAFPDPANVAPWYLRNITQALALDETTGNVYVRTDAQFNIANANITVGDVGITSLGNVDISGNALPITGNVVITSGNIAITSLPEVEVKNDANNPLPISANTSVNSLTNPIYVSGINDGSFFAPTQSDAFGRLRVSNPLTLFDTQARYFDHGQFANSISGSGSVTYDANSSTFALSTGGTGSVIRETLKTFIYQPGKSLLILNTFAMNSLTAGVTQRVGYYNTDNGVFFEANGTTLNMVVRSRSSGSIVEDRVAQSSWNGDPLDGTGPSGITLNPALTQIFWCDIEWLGVGSVRCGFVINGQYIVCHTFNHANVVGNTTTYMTTATLPIRYEISSSGTSATLRQICSTVISEGGYSLSGVPSGIGHILGTPVRLPNDQSFIPLIAIRLKSTNPDAVVVPVNFTIVPEDQALIKFNVYQQAVTSGGSWANAVNGSSVQYNLAPTSLVSGNPATSGFLISNNQSINAPQDAGFTFEAQLSRNPFTPTMYEYVITAATTGTNIDVYASIDWQEIS